MIIWFISPHIPRRRQSNVRFCSIAYTEHFLTSAALYLQLLNYLKRSEMLGKNIFPIYNPWPLPFTELVLTVKNAFILAMIM